MKSMNGFKIFFFAFPLLIVAYIIFLPPPSPSYVWLAVSGWLCGLTVVTARTSALNNVRATSLLGGAYTILSFALLDALTWKQGGLSFAVLSVIAGISAISGLFYIFRQCEAVIGPTFNAWGEKSSGVFVLVVVTFFAMLPIIIPMALSSGSASSRGVHYFQATTPAGVLLLLFSTLSVLAARMTVPHVRGRGILQKSVLLGIVVTILSVLLEYITRGNWYLQFLGSIGGTSTLIVVASGATSKTVPTFVGAIDR